MYYRPGWKSSDFGNTMRVSKERFRLPADVRNAPTTVRTARVKKVLIPVQLMDGADRAIAHFVDSDAHRLSTEVHLLNVQRLSMKGDFALDAAPDIECRAKRAIGMEVLNYARAPLDAEGIACKTGVLFGDPADTIAKYVREHRINAIVMEPTERHWLRQLFYGASVSAKVARMPDVEVTLVSRAGGHIHSITSNNDLPHVPRAVNWSQYGLDPKRARRKSMNARTLTGKWMVCK